MTTNHDPHVLAPLDVVRALFAVNDDGAVDLSALDRADVFVAEDLINHAAGPQGRDGWKSIVRTIDADLGPITIEHHHLIADGPFVAHHMTIHGTHRGSTMPLLADRKPTSRPVSWTFMHLWRVVDGLIVEHWACRDDLNLLAQIDRPD